MPQIKSAIKRLAQNKERQDRNHSYKERIKTLTKQLKISIKDNNKESAEKLLLSIKSGLDKGAIKGVFHKNTASRKVSRLSKALAAIKK